MVEDAGHEASVGSAAGFGAVPGAAVVAGDPQTLGGVNGLTNKNFFWAWFLVVNASFLVLAIFLPFAVAFPFIGIAGAIFSLFASKWLAMRAHRIQVIDPAAFRSGAEAELHAMVAELSSRAGLPSTPEVGVYESPDMNAFATGASQSNSLVAFSTALIEKLPAHQVRAVAAHEVAHIANRDMLAIVLLQGVINSVALVCVAPLHLLKVLNWFSDRFSWAIEIVLTLAHVVVSAVVLFLGSLVTKAFSRAREFRADALAAHLIGSDHMAGALESISREKPLIPREQLGYAAFKISGAPGIAEVLSTHPPVAKRIAALRAMALPERPGLILPARTVDGFVPPKVEGGGRDARVSDADGRGRPGDGRHRLRQVPPRSRADCGNVPAPDGRQRRCACRRSRGDPPRTRRADHRGRRWRRWRPEGSGVGSRRLSHRGHWRRRHAHPGPKACELPPRRGRRPQGGGGG